MTLPKKKSRNIEIDGTKYRWLTSKRNDTIFLSIETQENPQQLLQAFFEPHNSYTKNLENKWQKIKQGVSITPKLVRQVITHGLANGWKPNNNSKQVFYFHTWETDKIIPQLASLKPNEKRVKDIVIEQISDLRFDFSLDSQWRKKLFNAEVRQRFLSPSNYHAFSKKVKDCSLQFLVFNAGWTDYGFIILGIKSVEFPDIVMYTVNNPEII
ncbi:conserved hypothetical protein [Hyella patelloides LEGE 07179]|uniref:Uncharacterized protein n=2 Tax=Hyella TaxID=945733 RepID=A0A563VRY5_9CYAN|nr:conserved hypothetical protein [Hyella patelloides LEGE 07179]